MMAMTSGARLGAVEFGGARAAHAQDDIGVGDGRRRIGAIAAPAAA